jgi:hypothetical protein
MQSWPRVASASICGLTNAAADGWSEVAPPTVARRFDRPQRRTAKAALKGDPSFWGDEYPVRVIGSLRASSGKGAVLGFQFCHFNEPIDWDGLFHSREAYKRWVAKRGLLVSRQDHDGPATRHLAAYWLRRAYELSGVTIPDGSMYHAFRRLWATERKAWETATFRASVPGFLP